MPQRLGLGDVADPRPGRSPLAQRLAQDVGQEPAGKHDLGHAVACQPLDHVGEEGPVDQGQRRLRDRLGQRAQPGAFAADEDDRLHRLSPAGCGHGAVAGPADPLVVESRRAQRLGVEEVAPVDEQRPRHPLRRLGPVELGELGPLGDQHGGVGALERLERRVAPARRVEQLAGRSAATGS